MKRIMKLNKQLAARCSLLPATCYLLAALCCLFFIACDNPFMPNFGEEPTSTAHEENTPGSIPPGKGAFYLAINKIDARAIIPAVSSISSYILEFTNDTLGTLDTIEITSLNTPVFLSPGTYTLKVSAFSNYPNPAVKNLAAQAEITTPFTISEGANSPVSITLNAAISGDGTGSFKWNITVPSGITIDELSIKIFKYSNNAEVYDETPAINGNVISGQVDLDAGYYMFLLYLKKDNDTQPFSVFPVLHIYKNMESVFNLELTAANFTGLDATVTVTKGSDTTNHSSLTAALNSITTSGTYIVKIGEDQNLAPYTLNVQNADITLTAASAAVTVQLTEQGSMFTVNSGTTLRLSNGVTLQGISTNTIALVMVDGGSLYMSGTSRITGNTLTLNIDVNHNGGGIHVKNNGSFNMSGGIINNNKTLRNSGGIYVDSGTFKMTGGEISGNEAGQSAGGVAVNANAAFTMEGGEISGNTAGSNGGGLHVWGEFTLIDGVIKNNTATSAAGGVGVSADGTFTMQGGEISGNTAGSNGGGLYVWGDFNMQGGEISGNTVGNYGGGIYIQGDFIMQGGEISGNTVVGTGSGGIIFDGSGGGVHNMGNLIMQDGKINGNTAPIFGGGVSNRGAFTMNGGEISGNTSKENGGGVYNRGTFIIEGGEISGNSSTPNGGGVFNDGTFILGGTAIIKSNYRLTALNNVYLASGRYITLGDDINGANAPALGMQVFVANTTGVIVDTGASAGQEKYFKADTAGKVVAHEGVQLKIIDDPGELLFMPMNNETEYEVAMGTFKGTVINIPATHNGIPVTKIAEFGFNLDAYSAAKNITKVIIPSSVTIIASNAFSFCNYLTSVTFEGTIAADNFNATNSFPGDLRAKYLVGGIGTYTRAAGDGVWTKESQTGDKNITVNDVTGFNAALEQIRAGGNNKNYTIDITSNIFGITPLTAAPSSTTGFGTATDISITLTGNGTLSTANSNGSMFRLGSKQTLIIDSDNLTLQGRKSGVGGHTGNNNSAVVQLDNGAALNLKKGTITGNINSNYVGGGGVYIALGGILTIEGGTISYNTAYSGGGVYAGGTLLMTAGNIINNISDDYGGGVYIASGGNFTMEDGFISDNTAYYGGGVQIGNGSTFTMKGGTINRNTAIYGGGGVESTSGNFYKTGTSIITGYGDDPTNGNVAKDASGIRSNYGHAVLYGSANREKTIGVGVDLSGTGGTAPGSNWIDP